ncbi:MAG: tripartite tricarboxylate transporter TctB family protein [Candidatus Atribacteria bacterium]|nr:tripartite tricarboxylate transporter TctB family protein [Candidatus Atribacteria bacterium]
MADFLFGICTVIFGVILYWGANQLPGGVLTFALNPGFFPKIVAGGLIILGAILAYQGWKHKPTYDEGKLNKELGLRFGALLGLVFLYLILWGRGSFLLNTLIFLFLCQLIMKYRVLPSLLSSTVITFLTWILFTQAFKVHLF